MTASAARHSRQRVPARRGGGALTSTPLWLRSQERPLQAWLHRPEGGEACGGVVICPPLGLDLSHTHFNLRLLASKLEAMGFIVVRFDYDGTGQSAGDMSDPGRVASWIESISCAVELARGAGAEWIGAIGLRLGATLAARASVESLALDSLVLWDPYVSGRSFLREQVSMKAALQPPVSDQIEGIAIPGYVFTAEAVAELEELELPDASAPGFPRSLVVADPARPETKAVKRRLSQSDIEWREHPRSSRVIDIGALGYNVPHTLLDDVAAWVYASRGQQSTALRDVPAEPTSVTVGHQADGTRIVESLVHLGPTALFGIACRGMSAGAQAIEQKPPTVFFLSIAAESSIGPVRQWVDYSRRLAAKGIASVRFDFSGVGESPNRKGQPERPLYSPQAIADIGDAVQAICGEETRDAVLVGLCSGAYAALVAARTLHPRAVVAINPLMTMREFEEGNDTGDATTASGAVAVRARLFAVARGWVRRLRGFGSGSAWRKRALEALPPWLWRLVGAVVGAHSPGRLLEVAWKEDVPTLLICGQDESEAPKRYAPRALRRLVAARSSHFVEIPSLNHALLHQRNREEIFALLGDYLAEVAPACPTSQVIRELDSAMAHADASLDAAVN